MSARVWFYAVFAASSLFVMPSVAQSSKSAPAVKGEAQPTLAEYETQYRDKGLSRDTIELFYTIRVDRAAYDKVQSRHRHSDQKMIAAAKDTRDLRLTGRQNLEDIASLSRDEVAQLRKHAASTPKAGRK